MSVLGGIFIALGTFGVIFALNMETTVEVPGRPSQRIGFGEFSQEIPGVPAQRVNNIGFMDNRRNYLMLSCVSLVLGVVLLGFGALVEKRQDGRKGSESSPEP